MKIKVFELEFDASNLHEVAFVKEVITGSNLNAPAPEVVTAPEKEEKPVEEEETAYSPVPQVTVKPKRKKTEAPAPAPAPAPVEAAQETAPVETAPAPVETVQETAPTPAPVETVQETAPANTEPTAKEMQDLVIGLIKSGELSRDDVQTIFNEFGGTSLMKIAPSKFALLKQRLTTYNN